MPSFVDTNTRTFQADAAIAQYLRVYFTGGQISTAGAANRDIGVTDKASLAANEYVAVRLRNAAGTCKMTAADAITQGAIVYAAAGGKIDDAGADGGEALGYALEAVTADGDILEVLRCNIDLDSIVETVTAAAPALKTYGVTIIDSSSNAVDATLGSAPRIGTRKQIYMSNASNSSTVSVTKHATSDPEVFTFDAVDEALELWWTGTEWETVGTQTATT